MMFLPSCCPTCFNPHPIVRLDVSPWRVLPLQVSCGFNPHSIINLNVSYIGYSDVYIERRFNPHSIIKLNVRQQRLATLGGFNPHPIVRLDEDWRLGDIQGFCLVSVLIQLLDWM